MKSKKKQPSSNDEVPDGTESSPIETRSPASSDVQQRLKGPWSPAIVRHIKELIGEIHAGDKPFENADVVTEIIVTALKAVEAQIGRGDLKLLSRSLRELRYAFKIFKSYRNTPKVTIFGSARTPSTDVGYKMAHDFAKKLVDNGYMIITGAGPGIMQAGNEGAGAKGSFGVNIRLPYEQFPNPFIADAPTYIDCRYFFTRKLVFVKETTGAAFFPGGFGTLDEAFEILTLVQTGKCDPIPCVFVDTPKKSFWKPLIDFINDTLLKEKKISQEDLSLYKVTDSVDEAVAEIVKFFSNYHSIRYVGDRLVMRFRRPIDDKQLSHLNAKFTDLLKSGVYERSGPLKEEENQPELSSLPRLVFAFNRINNGRLRQMIDFMNKS
jgi:uncharacterized protein (TIGR00730 family)